MDGGINTYLQNEIKPDTKLKPLAKKHSNYEDISEYLRDKIGTEDDDLAPKTNSRPITHIDALDVNTENLKEYMIDQIGTTSEDNATHQHLVKFTSGAGSNDSSSASPNVNITDLLQLNSITDVRNMFNPASRYVTNYIFLDNMNRSTDTDGTYKTTWYINEGDPLLQTGVININFSMRDIVAMRMARMSFTCRTAFSQGIVQRKRISVGFDEFNAQSFVSPEGNRFHFIGNLDANTSAYANIGPSAYINTTSFYSFNHGKFNFRTPITKIDKLTMRLFCPFQPFPLDSENISGYVVSNSNPAQIVFTTEHGLNSDSITISGFTTAAPIADAALIAAINTTFAGGVYTIIDSKTITVPVNLTTMTPLTSGNSIINGYRVVQFTGVLEIVSLKSEEESL